MKHNRQLYSVAAFLSIAFSSSLNAASLPQLPKPYISRALHAVVLPIDDSVRKAFNLNPKDSDHGVVIVSVEPNGFAAKQGLVPGDVVGRVHGKKFRTPVELDEIITYHVKHKHPHTLISYHRAGKVYNIQPDITLDLLNLAIDVATVGSWSSWTTGYSFSYTEWYSSYPTTYWSESYTSSAAIIYEADHSKAFYDEYIENDHDHDGIIDVEDTDYVDTADDDIDDDGVLDNADDDIDGDGIDNAQDNDDDGSGYADDDPADDSGDESSVEEEQ